MKRKHDDLDDDDDDDDDDGKIGAPKRARFIKRKHDDDDDDDDDGKLGLQNGRVLSRKP